jgi:hypothetical protein
MTPDELPADMEARTPAPEGEAWRTVPVEPTEAMLVNGREALMPLVRLDSYGPLIGVWGDMLAASPVVPAPEGEAVDRVMAVLNYWFDGSRRIDRNSEMVAQLATLASPVVPVGVSEDQRRRVAALIAKPGLFSTDNETAHRAASPHSVYGERDKALAKADAIIAALRPTDTGANHD